MCLFSLWVAATVKICDGCCNGWATVAYRADRDLRPGVPLAPCGPLVRLCMWYVGRHLVCG